MRHFAPWWLDWRAAQPAAGLWIAASAPPLPTCVCTHPPVSRPRPSALQRGFSADWLGNTFSQAVFLGNGLMAIMSGGWVGPRGAGVLLQQLLLLLLSVGGAAGVCLWCGWE